MLNYFTIPSFSNSVLKYKVLTRLGDFAMQADKRLSATQSGWTITSYSPASILVNTDTYVVVKATTPQFSANVLYRNNGVYANAIVLQGSRILVPVNFSAVASNTVVLDDGNYTYDLAISSVASISSVAGSFSVSATYKNTLQIIGDQKVLVEGTGFNSVDTITDDESQVIDFTILNDTMIVMTTTALTTTGAHTYTFKNAASTTLGTTSLTFTDENDLQIESFFWQTTGDEVILSLEYDEDYIVVANNGSGTYIQRTNALTDLITEKNKRTNNLTRIVRDKNGVVVSGCPYSVKNINGTTLFRSTADYNGVITINISIIPSQIILCYDRADLPIKEEYIEV